MSLSRIDVVAGVIVENGAVLISLRPVGKHKAGYWEFPGGKIESDELIRQALARELKEELDIDVLQSEPWLEISHDYPDKSVYLHFWWVNHISGSPKGLEGQQVKWVPVEEIDDYEFPEANVPIVAALKERLA